MSKKQNKKTDTPVPETGTAVLDVAEFITEYDIYLFREGKHFSLYEKLGAHLIEVDGVKGTFFAVWAPNAKSVSVIGNFNGWLKDANHLKRRDDESGIWQGFVPGVGKGEAYKYFIQSQHNNYTVEKADPVAFYSEQPPKTASVVWEYNYNWNDQKYMETRHKKNALDSPYSVYEVHLESWRRKPEQGNQPLSYSGTGRTTGGLR
jgi:1,4-alpha-glucan branching enzyme